MRQMLQQKVDTEYKKYKLTMLNSSKDEIYNSVCQIRFYANLYEYFYYNERIPLRIQKIFVGIRNVLDTLWGYYLKYEQFSIENWEDITSFLEILCNDVKINTRLA